MLTLVDTCLATPAARGRLCACLEPSAFGRLRAVAGDCRLMGGEVLFAQGDSADELFGLRQGAVMLVQHLGKRRQVLSFLFPGDTFGFAEGGVHGCTAIVLRRAGFCRFPLSALDGDPQLASRLHAIARARLLDGLDQLLRLGRMTAAERLADFLYWLWQRLDRPVDLHLPMRLMDVADHLGLRPETISRQMTALREAGLIGGLSVDGILPVFDGPGLRRR